MRETAEKHFLKEIVENRNAELSNVMGMVVELEQREAGLKNEVEVWKGKTKTAEKILWNLNPSPQRHVCRRAGCPVCGGEGQEEEAEEEESASSFIWLEIEEHRSGGRSAYKFCGKRMATIVMWPCRHLCVCKRCDGDNIRAFPVCGGPSSSTLAVHPD